ncbi:MAG: 1-acyl-sn-glycerol-3-phosphate acyltransferase [Bradymonadaceae bacterium]
MFRTDTARNQDSPLFNFNQDRTHLVSEVCRRAYSEFLSRTRTREHEGLEHLLNDAAYQEVERLEVEQGPEDEIRSQSWWLDISKRVGEMSESEKRAVLRDLIESYAEDIAGRFNPKVYRLATGALPFGLSFLFKAQDIKELPNRFINFYQEFKNLRDLTERVVIEGHTDTLQKLATKGTLVVVPTHSSNMDSILMGWSLFESGLPPVTYGAGKNLFTNPLTSFFMHNLGAYKVDRRLKHDLYKSVLKIYSQVLLERGYHSLFFPGGTRCRSNIVEDHLKLGLLGTTIEAYIHNLLHYGAERPLYICPVTINYNLVLEAESLIDDHLRREGGRRYFLEKDEFNQISQVVRFSMNTMQMDSTTIIRYGRPMDPFGNLVRDDGHSYDQRGRRVDPTSFVRSSKSGQVTHDAARDREYTRHTGRRVAQAFRKNTVLMPTQIVAYTLFELLRNRFPNWDVYELLRLATGEVIPWFRIESMLEETLRALRRRKRDGELRLSPIAETGDPAAVQEAGIDSLTSYHVPTVIERMGDGVLLNSLDLLYYYGNRVRTYDLDGKKLLARSE